MTTPAEQDPVATVAPSGASMLGVASHPSDESRVRDIVSPALRSKTPALHDIVSDTLLCSAYWSCVVVFVTDVMTPETSDAAAALTPTDRAATAATTAAAAHRRLNVILRMSYSFDSAGRR